MECTDLLSVSFYNTKSYKPMYSTKTAVTTATAIGDILDLLDDYDIYSYYLGTFKVNKLINSPLRTDDKNPSFAVFVGHEGKLFFKDHGSGEGGNAVTFVKLINNIHTREELEKELLRILRRQNPGRKRVIKYEYEPTHNTVIGIARQPFNDIDLQYWGQFHISLPTLNKYRVFSIKYFLCNGTVRGVYKETCPMYAYKVFDRFKIYRPLSSKYTKWRSNLTNYDVQGLAELPAGGGDVLIITKSLKDVMTLYEMGYNAIAASSETTFIPDDILNKLKPKWKTILILYDRDETGVKKARDYSRKYGFDAFFINKKFKAKDISDAVKNNDYENVKNWLAKELQRYGNL